MRASVLRLDDCGDFLNLAQYANWRGLSPHQVRRQVKAGTCFVLPCEETPHLLWRRVDCARRLANANIVRERQLRAKSRPQVAG